MQPVTRHSSSAEAAPALRSEFLSGEGQGWRVVFDEAAGAPALMKGTRSPDFLGGERNSAA